MREWINIVEGRQSIARRYCAKVEAQHFGRTRVGVQAEDEFDVAITGIATERGEWGHGHASAALKFLCTLADRMGVDLFLEAHPNDEDDDMDFDRLVALYRRFGFEGEPDMEDGSMWRHAKVKKSA